MQPIGQNEVGYFASSLAYAAELRMPFEYGHKKKIFSIRLTPMKQNPNIFSALQKVSFTRCWGYLRMAKKQEKLVLTSKAKNETSGAVKESI